MALQQSISIYLAASCYICRPFWNFRFKYMKLMEHMSKLRSRVDLQSASDPCTNMSGIGRHKSRKTKIWYFGSEVFVKQDIACLDVSMHYMWTYFLMKIFNPTSYSYADSRTCSPRKFNATVPAAYILQGRVKFVEILAKKGISSKFTHAILVPTLIKFLANKYEYYRWKKEMKGEVRKQTKSTYLLESAQGCCSLDSCTRVSYVSLPHNSHISSPSFHAVSLRSPLFRSKIHELLAVIQQTALWWQQAFHV